MKLAVCVDRSPKGGWSWKDEHMRSWGSQNCPLGWFGLLSNIQCDYTRAYVIDPGRQCVPKLVQIQLEVLGSTGASTQNEGLFCFVFFPLSPGRKHSQFWTIPECCKYGPLVKPNKINFIRAQKTRLCLWYLCIFYFSIATSFPFLGWVKQEHDLDNKGLSQHVAWLGWRKKERGIITENQERREESLKKGGKKCIWLFTLGIQYLFPEKAKCKWYWMEGPVWVV